jgi:hypothetical protein
MKPKSSCPGISWDGEERGANRDGNGHYLCWKGGRTLREVRALVEDWQDTALTRLLLDADRVARDPALVLSAEGMATRTGRRIFARGGGTPSTPVERFAEVYRRAVGPIEVGPQRLEEAAFARVHRADVVMVGRALEHGSAQHERLRSIQPETRVQLLLEIRRAIDSASDELVRLGTLEGHTRKGMERELERIRSVLSEEVLGWIASTLVKKKYSSSSRGLGPSQPFSPPSAPPPGRY